MEISNLSLIISTFLVVIGWFVTSYFNRKHEKIKKRTEYRLITLQSFILIKNSFTSSSTPFEDDKNLKKKIEDSRINFQLYGYQDELDLFEDFIKVLEKADIPKTVEVINKLIKLTNTRLREELVLPKINI
jgi:hypothetical protein